jgi:hypothetical protein
MDTNYNMKVSPLTIIEEHRGGRSGEERSDIHGGKGEALRRILVDGAENE